MCKKISECMETILRCMMLKIVFAKFYLDASRIFNLTKFVSILDRGFATTGATAGFVGALFHPPFFSSAFGFFGFTTFCLEIF